MNNNNNKFKNVMTRIGCGTLALLSTSSLSCGMKKNNSTNTNSQENNALTTETIIDNSEDNNVETLTPVKEKTVDISYIPIVMYPERKTKGDMIGEIDIYSSIIDKLQKDMEGSKTETGETKKMAIKFMVPSSWYYKMLRYSDNLGYHHYMFCEGYQGYIEYNTNYPFMVGYEYKKHEMEKISPNAFELTGEEQRVAIEKIYNQTLRQYQKYGYTKRMNIADDIRYISVEEISDFHNAKIEANPHAGDIRLKIRNTITLSDGTEMYVTDYCLRLKTKRGDNAIYVWSIYSPTREIQYMLEEYFENNITGIYDTYMSVTPVVYDSGYTRKKTLMNK